ncbi:MAG: hypothetical protein ACXW61_07515 [Gemmatirosa sp.]
MSIARAVRRPLALLAAAAVACARPAAVATPVARADAPPCRWPSPPEIVRQSADTIHLRWTARTDAIPDAWTPDALPALRDFRAAIGARIESVDAHALLRRQADYWAGRSEADGRRESENGRLVLSGAVGTLRPIACLEALLLDHQAARVPMAARPTEFQALVLRRAATDTAPAMVRVYAAASHAPWPPKLGPIVDSLVARDRRDGWTVHAHLHNHPFYLDRAATDIAGANAPSLSDAQYYRALHASLGLERAWITNGFTTVEIPARDFVRLSIHR